MHVRFDCPGCGKKLKGSEEHSGKQTKCPSCGKCFVIPVPAVQPEVTDGAAALSEAAAPPPSPTMLHDREHSEHTHLVLPGKGWGREVTTMTLDVPKEKVLAAMKAQQLHAVAQVMASPHRISPKQIIKIPRGVCSNCCQPCDQTYQFNLQWTNEWGSPSWQADIPECTACARSKKTWILQRGALYWFPVLWLILVPTLAILVGRTKLGPPTVLAPAFGLVICLLCYGLFYGVTGLLARRRVPVRDEQTTHGSPVRIKKRGNGVRFIFTNSEYARLFARLNDLKEHTEPWWG